MMKAFCVSGTAGGFFILQIVTESDIINKELIDSFYSMNSVNCVNANFVF